MQTRNTPTDDRRAVNFVIDLLAIPGAYAASVEGENVIVIPMTPSEVNYSPAKPGVSERATIRAQATVYGERYHQKVLEGQLSRRGRCNESSVPTHSLHIAHSRKYIRQCIRNKDVVDGVIALNRNQYPEIVCQDPSDRHSLLYTLIMRHINVRIAQGYSGRYDPDRLSTAMLPNLRRLNPAQVIDDGTSDLPY